MNGFSLRPGGNPGAAKKKSGAEQLSHAIRFSVDSHCILVMVPARSFDGIFAAAVRNNFCTADSIVPSRRNKVIAWSHGQS
jgi:hypothetical protein